MISFSSAQLDAWLAAFVFPLARILALLATMPPYNNAALPQRIRLIIGLAITFVVAPSLPPMPAIAAGSWLGLLVLAQQVVVGVTIGFTMRLAFAAIDLAGDLIGLQMGLSFARFYDPQSSAQTAVLGDFLGIVTILVFLALNGHLLAISALVESFRLLPIATASITVKGAGALLSWAAIIFSAGVLLSLPMMAALLIANIAMGVLTRVAPQLNLFAVGFPVTIVSGFVVLLISLPYFGAALERLFDQAFGVLRMVIQASGAS
jgi:flagellar biosynthesis protein FliR